MKIQIKIKRLIFGLVAVAMLLLAGKQYREYAVKKVNVHDFPDKNMGQARPYGVYDLACNEGWVSVGILPRV